MLIFYYTVAILCNWRVKIVPSRDFLFSAITQFIAQKSKARGKNRRPRSTRVFGGGHFGHDLPVAGLEQRDYLLTLELVNFETGKTEKESAEIRKGYHKSRLGKLRNYGKS